MRCVLQVASVTLTLAVALDSVTAKNKGLFIMTQYYTIPDDQFRYQIFDRNNKKFEYLHEQMRGYNAIVQNEMIFTLDEVNKMQATTLAALDEMKEYILQQRKELDAKMIAVDNPSEYQKHINKKYEQQYGQS